MDTTPRPPALGLEQLRLTYRQGPREVGVLQGASAAIYPGETVALVGPSGAGKSSLLHIAGLLDRPDSGSVFIDGRDCLAISDRERTRARRKDIGFIYQFHHLLPEFSALENVVLPQLILGTGRKTANQRAEELLSALGLSERIQHRPAELSGGEQQRVAIARAVANGPKILLADEPTGNLDPNTAGRVFDQLMQLTRGAGLAALIATHNYELAGRMDRILVLRDGMLVEEALQARQPT